MRIREFDGSGGRIELYCALVRSVLTLSPVVLQSLAAEKSVKEFFRFGFCFRAKFIIRI